jgi:ribosomal protein S18 acetylase RimI-like enzyme
VTIQFLNIAEHLDVFDRCLDEMDHIWHERTQAEGLKSAVLDKVLKELGKTIEGVIAFVDDEVAGVYWAEINTQYYGNITFHSTDASIGEALVIHALNAGIFTQRQMEIVQVIDSDVFRKSLDNAGCIKNHRERMSLWLEEGAYFNAEAPEIEVDYYLLSKEHKDITAKISFDAHQISQDYYMYPEMNQLDKRIALEDRVHKGLFGNVIDKASILVCHKGVAIGYCLFVEVACWGFEKVPWVFDIAIAPGYDGKGIGRELFKMCLNILTELKYPIVGLAVTKNNYAKKLYEKLEFQHVDDFYEYIKLD